MSKKTLEVKKLKKYYSKKIKAIDSISFEVNQNEIFALIGPNGAGKSTTLKIITTLLSPTSGTVEVLGQSVKDHPDKIRKNISYLPEEAGAYRNFTGIQYLNFMAEIVENNKQKKEEMIERALKICNLKNRINDKINTYSKGMTRKLLLARTLMNRPKLAVLDEPTSGLDVINAIEVRKIIKQYCKSGMSVLLSSHNMLEIEYLSDRLAIINKGKIIESGTTKSLKNRYSCKNLEEVFIKVAK